MTKRNSNLPVKGTMDFPPEAMRQHNYLCKIVNDVASRFHFEEYDLPTLESWETFAQKSSEEILNDQSYHFVDRGDRKLILRPEITPSLARMVSKDVKNRPLPLRWYTIGRCYRYENPQMGRLREFHQLNFDILGKNHPLFDIEIIRVAIQLLSSLKVEKNKYIICYNHRHLVNFLLEANHFSAQEKKDFFYLIDRREKLSQEVFASEVEKKLKKEKGEILKNFLKCSSIEEVWNNLIKNDSLKKESSSEMLYNQLILFEELLTKSNLRENCVFSPSVVRGFDYYTGMVFEVFDQSKNIRRSIFGGGRYDDLIGRYSDEKVSGVGFGMGTYVLSLFLKNLGLLKSLEQAEKRIMIAPLEEDVLGFCLILSEKLMEEAAVEISTPAKVKSHFKKAEQKNFTHIILIGEEEQKNQLYVLRDVKTGDEKKYDI